MDCDVAGVLVSVIAHDTSRFFVPAVRFRRRPGPADPGADVRRGGPTERLEHLANT